MDTNDNLFSSLKGLVWSAIIGVASFQVLAPNVWGYIHEALSISYQAAYWIFMLTYFLCLPLCMLAWLHFNWDLLARYFDKLDREGMEEKPKKMLKGLFGFISFQLITTVTLFGVYVAPWVHFVLFGSYACCCALFLIGYTRAAWGRINYNDPSVKSGFDTKKVRQYYQQLMGVTVPFFIVLFMAGFFYAGKWHLDKKRNHRLGGHNFSFNAGSRGFALTILKDTLDGRNSALAKFGDGLRYDHQSDTLDALSHIDSFTFDRLEGGTIRLHPDIALRRYFYALDAIAEKIKELNRKLADTATDVQWQSIDSLKDAIPVWNGQQISPIRHYPDDLRFVQLLQVYIAGLSSKVDGLAKIQLGEQMRSTQVKGIMLLISLFFTIFSLFIYLSINRRLQDAKLKHFQDCRRLNQLDNEQILITQENNAADSMTISDSLWLYLTVIVWLLVPLFKPVNDADINIKTPYKAHTFSNPGTQTFIGGSTGTHSNDTTTFYQKTILTDSIFIENDSLKYQQLMDSINIIKKKVEHVHKQLFNY